MVITLTLSYFVFELFDTEASKALERCKLNNFSNATITEGIF